MCLCYWGGKELCQSLYFWNPSSLSQALYKKGYHVKFGNFWTNIADGHTERLILDGIVQVSQLLYTLNLF